MKYLDPSTGFVFDVDAEATLEKHGATRAGSWWTLPFEENGEPVKVAGTEAALEKLLEGPAD